MEKVIFPIIRHVVYGGKTYDRQLNKGDMVKCWCCGETFKIDSTTVTMAADGMQIVCCPNWNCRKRATVLDYFDKVIKPSKPVKKQKKKYKEYRTNCLKEPKKPLLNDKYVKDGVA